MENNSDREAASSESTELDSTSGVLSNFELRWNRDVMHGGGVANRNKNVKLRMDRFVDYLVLKGRLWYEPDIAAYHEYLEKEEELAARSVYVHLSTVTQRYKEMLARMPKVLKHIKDTNDKHPMPKGVDYAITRATDLIEKAARYPISSIDLPDDIPLKHPMKHELTEIFDVEILDLQVLRDVILAALPFCAGLTEAEIIELKVEHLIYDKPRELGIPLDYETSISAIAVPRVHKNSEREAKINDHILFIEPWLSKAMVAWMELAKIQKGYLFLGFYRGGQNLRDNPITLDAYQKALKGFMDRMIERKQTRSTEPTQSRESSNATDQDVDSHQSQKKINYTALDLRRGMARRLYMSGFSMNEVKEAINVQTQSTALLYVGPPDPMTGLDIRSEYRPLDCPSLFGNVDQLIAGNHRLTSL